MTLPPDQNGQDEFGETGGEELDPIKWLESLAKRQGAKAEEFMTSADIDVPEVDPNTVIDEPGYVDYDPFGSPEPKHDRPAAPRAASEPAPPAASSTSSSASDDASGEIDPMAWLESLAKRQGANPEEFVTEANLDVPEADPDSVIDEPGYTPYDSSGGFGAPSRAAAPPEPDPEPEPAQPEPTALADEGDLTAAEAAAILGLDTGELLPPQFPAEAAPAQEAPPPPAAEQAPPAEVSGDAMAEVDPLAWLESLAKRQGARSEEFITAADLDVPEADANAVIDEPGYTDYSPFDSPREPDEEPAATATPAQAPLFAESAAEPPAAEETPSGSDTLAWLEGLAAEQGALPVEEADADPLAGLTETEIETQAAAGDLTPEQMEAWLNRQAASLAHHRAEAEVPSEDDDLSPAEPAELPAWLQEARPTEPAAPAEPASPEPAPLVDAIAEPPEPADLPNWLREEAPAANEDLRELLGVSDDELGVEEVEQAAAALEDNAYDDPWAAALDEEYVTHQLGQDEEEPEWYRSALEDPDRQSALADHAAQPQGEAEPIEPAEAQMPDWLRDAAPVEAAGEDIPDWLNEELPTVNEEAVDDWLTEPAAEVEEPADLAEAEIPDWLREPDAAEPANLPSWLADAAPEPPAAAEPPAPAPEPVLPVPAPVSAPVPAAAAVPAPVPDEAAYADYRARLDANPADHGTRLALARALRQNRDLPHSLGQYEALVTANELLPDVEADLADVVQQTPAPEALRILGDARVRQGRLQDALDAYRTALEQL